MNRWLTRRAAALGVLAVVLIVLMTLMGLWQLSVFDERQQQEGAEQLTRRPVPLSEVMGPDSAYPADAVGRPVTVAGRYVADEQMYVEGLPGHDQRYAVVTPLVDATGSAVLVVRGSSDRRDAAAPEGPVTVEGILEPSTARGRALDDRRVSDGLRIPVLVPGFREDLYSGYVILTDSAPADALPPVEAPTPDPSLLAGLRNLAYALQWWVFAGFVAFMWWRIVRDTEPEPPVDVG